VIPRLETERLLLRGFEERDLDEYAAITADPEVMRYMGRGPYDRAGAWRDIAVCLGHFDLRGYTHWALESRESGELIGRCGPWRPEGWPALEVGWLLGREHWGRGYASEAGRTALDFAWRELGADRVISLVLPGNERSERVAARLGGRKTERQVVRGLESEVFEYPRPG
jgi:ribosomal-protein-alanine N-acetyltransferase